MKNVTKAANLKIFICAHKPIENPIPKGEEYVIIALNDSIKDSEHEVIYLTDDEFTKNHWRCYGEGCAMRYLWLHPDLIPEYIGIAHYRRFFTDFVGREEEIIPTLEKYQAIISYPFVCSGRLATNWSALTKDHFAEISESIKQIVNNLFPDFATVYNKTLNESFFYPCNVFIMKKSDFLQMCNMCFAIFEEFDKKYGFYNNEDVYRYVIKRWNKVKSWGNLEWLARLQGFYLEWLTSAFYTWKFGINNCYISKVNIPYYGN